MLRIVLKVGVAVMLLAIAVCVSRVALLRGATQGALWLAGGELIALDGLQMGRGRLSVDTLAFRLGEDGAPQLVKGVDLRYSLRQRRIRSLHVNRLQLAPIPAVPGEAAGLDPVQMLQTLMSIPLDSARVDGLLWPGLDPVTLEWGSQRSEQWRLQLVQGEKRLSLILRERSDAVIELAACLTEGQADLASVDASLAEQATGYRFEARAELAAALLDLIAAPALTTDPEAGLDLELQGDLPGGELQRVSLDVVARLQAAELSAGDVSLLGNRAELRATLRWDSRTLTLELAPDSRWRSASIRTGDLLLEAPSLALNQAATIAVMPSAITVELPAAGVNLPRVAADHWHAATVLRLSDLRARFSTETGELIAGAGLATDSLNIRRPDRWLPIVALTSTIALQGQNLSARGEIDSDRGKRLLRYDAVHDLQRARGSLRLSTGPLIFGEGEELLGRYFSWWPFEFDLRAGRSETDAQLNWSRAGLRGRFQQELEAISGFYQEIGFLAVDAELAGSFVYPDELVIDKEGLIRIQALDVGIPFEEIEMRFGGAIRPLSGQGARRDKLHLSGFDASLFGGRVSAGEHLLLRHRPPGFLTLRFDEVNLEKLLAATGYTAVEARGLISGRLPFRLDGQGLTMRDGRFLALAPGGIFRYRASGGGDSPGAAVALVQQALSNYHYSSLSAAANYSASGDLVMKLKLDGSNPDLNRGQRVILNLTLEDNVPALLKSLQAGRRIEELVDRYVAGDGASDNHKPSEKK